ncbi:MAG: nitronate monooxygenase [Phycisphaerales bacterium]|nr:nitronate monooxygenase [Phycisphaerales bacterium]
MTGNRVCTLFKIEYPIIQAGMVWVSGWRLASAVTNAGGLGMIGAGSMRADLLEEHIVKCKQATNKPFAVNLPLFFSELQQQIDVILKHEVPIIFTSAGSPKAYINQLKAKGSTVVHVVSSSKFALKAQDAGCDAVVAEGFEAGGHNGKEETTTLVLINAIKNTVQLPIIAAGGIATGRQMLACFALGAEGVQVGTRFVCTHEASAHINFKNSIVEAEEGDTLLQMKKIGAVRLLRNPFALAVKEAEERGATSDELHTLLGKYRAKKGMLEGDLKDGELEIGQVSSIIKDIVSASSVVKNIWEEFNQTLASLNKVI